MVRQANLVRKASTEIVEINVEELTHEKGDFGYYMKGKADRYRFTAAIGNKNGWHKTGWKVGRILGLEYGEEYRNMFSRIKEYLNTNYSVDRIENMEKGV